MSKIGNKFRDFRDRVRASVNVRSHNALFFLALFLIVFLAVLLRLSPLLRGPILIKAFDPWIQFYNANYLSEHSLYEYFTWWDFKSWYPGGTDRYTLRPGLTFSVVAIYQALNMVGIPITIYEVCYYFPAFMGGLTILAAYFLGKEILNRQMGLFAAFFLAFNTGHMQRTMAGFFDNETIGVFSSLMTILFFLKAVRTGKITHSVIGGAFLGYLSLSWGGYQFVYLIIPMIIGIMVLTNKYNENMLIAYAGVEGTGLFVFGLYKGFYFPSLFSSLEIGGIFFFTIILLVFHIIFTKKAEYPKLYNNIIKGVVWALIPSALIMAVILWIAPEIIPFGFGTRIASILSPLLRDSLHIVASVAEHMPSAWSIFYYNTLIPMVLLPLGIFFCFKRLNVADITLMIFLLTIFYFTGSMIRIILLFAPAAALMGAYGLVSVLKLYGSFIGEKRQGISRKRRRQIERTVGNSEVALVYFLVGFLCIAQVVHAADISVNQLSYNQMAAAGGQFHDWEESLTWMRNNLAGTDVVVSWWDYGYWLTPIGNVTTINDNATWNISRIGLTGMAFMQTNEIYSAKILRALRADYILVYYGGLVSGLGGDEGKWPWMVRICNDYTSLYRDWGFEEDNWEEDVVFDESKYHNMTSGLREERWFESQVARLMFHAEPTDLSIASQMSYIQYYFAASMSGGGQGIGQLEDDNGRLWKDHLTPYLDGEGYVNYDFKVFKPKYFSKSHMVKLYTVDYTALDSSFTIEEENVFDNGQSDYSVFKLNNTGTRDLTITNVYINNEEYPDFKMGEAGSSKILKTGTQDTVWVDINATSRNFEIDDVVNISVTAEAQALENTKYSFSESTSNLFVIAAKEENIRINRINSVVNQPDTGASPNIFLEVENIGDSIVYINDFYLRDLHNQDTYFFNASYTNFIGSPILEPGEKVNVEVYQSPLPFYPYGLVATSYIIGVKTINNADDETLFSSNEYDYKLSIIDQERTHTPEIAALNEYSSFFSSPLRDNIPFSLNKSHAINYNNGTTIISVDVKNTGDIQLGLQTVLLTDSNLNYISSDKYTWDMIDSDLILYPGEENTVEIIVTEQDVFETNEEIFISLAAMGIFGTTAASDVGFLQTIRDAPDFQIIEIIETDENSSSSIILANETGYLTIKNTGNESITLDKIIANQTDVLNVTYLFGNETLDIQDVAIISFQINDSLLAINDTNEVDISVNTTSGLTVNKTFQAYTNPFDYTIKLDNSTVDDLDQTQAVIGGNLDLVIDNLAFKNVTVNNIIINGTYIPMVNFTLSSGYSLDIGPLGGSITLEIAMSDLNTIVAPINFIAGNKMRIIVRTKEGAEFNEIINVS
jgi:dolichyl-diphosphooligosaccharide--protein glycosyltransferase